MIWNREEARAALGCDDEFVDELLELFAAEAPRLLSEAREGFADEDYAKVTKAAHTLKSNAALLCARSAQEAALEAEYRSDDEKALEKMESEFAALLRALKVGSGSA